MLEAYEFALTFDLVTLLEVVHCKLRVAKRERLVSRNRSDALVYVELCPFDSNTLLVAHPDSHQENQRAKRFTQHDDRI